jgi:hypothetical protein
MHCARLEPQQYPGMLLWCHILCLDRQTNRAQVLICSYEIQVFLQRYKPQTRKCKLHRQQ